MAVRDRYARGPMVTILYIALGVVCEQARAIATWMANSLGAPVKSPLESRYSRQLALPDHGSPSTSFPSIRIVGDPQPRSCSGVPGAAVSISSISSLAPKELSARLSSSRAAEACG